MLVYQRVFVSFQIYPYYFSQLLSMNDMTDMTWIVNDCNNHHNHSF